MKNCFNIDTGIRKIINMLFRKRHSLVLIVEQSLLLPWKSRGSSSPEATPMNLNAVRLADRKEERMGIITLQL
jgi:hypothetical protein